MFHFMPKSRATTCGRRPAVGAVAPPAGSCAQGLKRSCHSRRSLGHDLAHQVAADQARGWPWPWPPGWRRRGRRSTSTPFMAPQLRMRRTRARVSMPAMADDAELGQVVVQRAVERKLLATAAAVADDEAGQLRPAAFDVLGVDAVVADLRVGHGDDLAAVAGIGEDLLITGHRGVETDLAVDLSVGAERRAGENGTVFQSQLGDVMSGLMALRPAAGVRNSAKSSARDDRFSAAAGRHNCARGVHAKVLG